MFQVSILTRASAAKTVLSFFLALKLEKGIVLHVLTSTLGNLFWTKEGSCSGKVLMAFSFQEGLDRGIFPCNPYRSVPKFGQTVNVLKICVCGMQKSPEVSCLTAVQVLSAVGVPSPPVLSTAAFSEWALLWPST